MDHAFLRCEVEIGIQYCQFNSGTQVITPLGQLVVHIILKFTWVS